MPTAEHKEPLSMSDGLTGFRTCCLAGLRNRMPSMNFERTMASRCCLDYAHLQNSAHLCLPLATYATHSPLRTCDQLAKGAFHRLGSAESQDSFATCSLAAGQKQIYAAPSEARHVQEANLNAGCSALDRLLLPAQKPLNCVTWQL